MNNTLTLDLDHPGKPLNKIWEFGVNTCHSALWLRKDLPEHLALLQKSCGFRYIRCHGNLNDDLGVCAPEGTFHFDKLIQVIETIRKAGLKPFLELSSMPSAMASGDKTICFYKFRTDPPKDWNQYRMLIRALISALEHHFGKEELCTWYFEVWNEPDISFWAGTQDEYFRMYDIARNEIKKADARYRIGGPATSKTAWIPEFAAHCAKPSAEDPDTGFRCDFVSTHAYPNDVAFVDSPVGETKLCEADLMRRLFSRARAAMDAAGGKHVPLICGEWNSSAGPYAWNHDECGNAAFICKVMAELMPFCDGSLYWNATDIYEEGGFHYTPFHGGYGMINVNGIMKSSGRAFEFLHKLNGTRIPAEFEQKAEEFGVLAARSGDGTLRVLVWNYIKPDTEGIPLNFYIKGFKGIVFCTFKQIKKGNGSPYETWLKAGSPDFPDIALLEKLQNASEPGIGTAHSNDLIHVEPGTVMLLEFPVKPL